MLRWLQQLSLRRAAKSYARILPQRLLAGWGASEFYTPGQVRAAVGATGLGGRYVAIAFAAFLTREEFDALVPSHPHP